MADISRNTLTGKWMTLKRALEEWYEVAWIVLIWLRMRTSGWVWGTVMNLLIS
jgi:hypothetical protein